MSELNFNQHPDLSSSIMVAAWRGWPDAVGVASTAMEEALRQLPAKRLASIDHERFTLFSHTRPEVVLDKGGKRRLEMPSGRFYYCKAAKPGQQDLVLFLGDEPDLEWHGYSKLFAEVASVCDAQMLVTLGAFLDYVPHSVGPLVSMFAGGKLPERFRQMPFQQNTYEGPAAVSTLIEERFTHAGIPVASLWARSPHYIKPDYNPELVISTMDKLEPLLGRRLSTAAMEKQREGFTEELNKGIQEDNLHGYVAQLEEWYSTTSGEDLVKQVEQFLRTRVQE